MFLIIKIRHKYKNIFAILKKNRKSIQVRIKAIIILIIQLQSYIVISKKI